MADKKIKILVVDDMRTMRLIMKKTLAKIGYENIEEADDGTTAWDKLQAAKSSGSPFHLVFSDWNMPKMPGIELLKQMKQKPDFAKTPFIMVTAETEKEQILAALKAGVQHYVTKPFSPETIEQKLTEVLNTKAAA